MRGCCLLAVLAACSSPSREEVLVDAAAPPPDAFVEQVRPVTGVLVSSRGVTWTYGTDVCSLEGCWYGGPTVSRYEVKTGGVSVVDDSGAGAMTIAGDEPAAFIVTGVTHEERYVKQLGGSALSFPRPWTQGPAVDDTYVYWAEQTANGAHYTLRRATRTGDGNDGAALATVPLYVKQLVVHAGHVWLRDGSGTLLRVSTSGGASEDVATGIGAMTSSPIGLVVARGGVMNDEPYAEVGIVDDTGAYRGIARLPGQYAVRHIAADDREIYWLNGSADDFTIYKTSVTGSTVETVATGVQHRDAIALTATEVLYDFTPTGFKSIAR